MGDTADIVLQVLPATDEETEQLAEAAGRLRVELLDLDVQDVNLVTDTTAPEGAKGLETLAGWLGVYLGKEALRIVLAKVADWASRNDRTVEVKSGNDVLKLGKATKEQQEKIINAWLAAHAPGS
jgi:hypothetical protein